MEKPNLIYVFADQWRRHALGCLNCDPVYTPHMDAFSKEGVLCTGCTSTFPLCSPHRASLLTGKYPLSVGFYTNCKPGIPLRLHDDEYCMGDILKANGYQTAYIGKYHLDEPEVNHGACPVSGAREWDAFTPPGVRRHGFDYWYSYGTYDVHLHPHYWRDTPEMIQPEQWSVEHETEVAIRWLESVDRTRPFAVVISWNPPHPPYDEVPQKYLDLYSDSPQKRQNVLCGDLRQHTDKCGNGRNLNAIIRQYYAAVSGIDEQFGRLLDAVKRLCLEDNTIVVLSSDHGDMLGSHGLLGKHVWYEESIGIPFIVRGPGIPQGVCGSVFGSQDQLPTLLGLLGIEIPSYIEGADYSHDIRMACTNDESYTFLCACPGSAAAANAFEKIGKNPIAAGWRGIRTVQYTYVIDAGYDPEPHIRRLLYDLKADPLQNYPVVVENITADARAARLEAILCQWMRQQNDPFCCHIG